VRLLHLIESGHSDFLKKHQIVPEEGCIGKSKLDGKWYGWSHRACYGFAIGDTCQEGDCGFSPEKGTWTAKTDSDTRQMALDFAESVS